MKGSPLPPLDIPFDHEFYEALRSGERQLVSERVVPPNTGYGFRVEAGQTWRFVVVERAAAMDVFIASAENPDERYCMSSQISIEGFGVSIGTRIWGTPPESRPMATVIEDTYAERVRDRPQVTNHVGFGGHCNPHEWVEQVGWQHPHTCEDNLRDGLAMLGIDPPIPGENLNFGWLSWIDAETGFYNSAESTGLDGDYIELFAEIPVNIVVSLCPSGSFTGEDSSKPAGTMTSWHVDRELFERGEAPTYPCRVQIYQPSRPPERKRADAG